MNSWRKYQRELAALLAFVVLLVCVGIVAPAFFAGANLRDLLVTNAPVLLVAIGMTLVILAGQIDISVGSQFAVCSVVTGWLAKSGVPVPLLLLLMPLCGGLFGALNGALVAKLKMPAIVVTLAALVIWRDALRWITEGAWVQGLPANFQWFGLGQNTGQWLIVLLAALVLAAFWWTSNNLGAGRAVYAAGSDAEAARLIGIEPTRVVFWVFVLMGALTGLAAMLNTIRFNSVPANSGLGLEMKAIAAVVVGGASITGGRGTLLGTLIGTALLGTIGTALTYAGINPFWEKAIQGAIILAALVSDIVLDRLRNADFGMRNGSSATAPTGRTN
ncbi:MAG TPA: ABC transporter permease [Blastocatellia bacterium]|nr:ABC transporter permease [Blastocatellia bacterium]